MTQEEIRETWRLAATRFFTPPAEGPENFYRRKKETALEKLASKYKRFSIMSLVMIFVSSIYMVPHMLDGLQMRIWVSLAFMVYFAMASAMDYWLYKGITSIDCLTMTVKEVAEKAMYYRKMHLIFIAILFPIAVGVIILLLNAAGFEIYLSFGVCAGAIVGLAIGYRHFLEFMAEYRKLSE